MPPLLLLSAWESSILTRLVSEGKMTKWDVREGFCVGLDAFSKSKLSVCAFSQWRCNVGAQYP